MLAETPSGGLRNLPTSCLLDDQGKKGIALCVTAKDADGVVVKTGTSRAHAWKGKTVSFAIGGFCGYFSESAGEMEWATDRGRIFHIQDQTWKGRAVEALPASALRTAVGLQGLQH